MDDNLYGNINPEEPGREGGGETEISCSETEMTPKQDSCTEPEVQEQREQSAEPEAAYQQMQYQQYSQYQYCSPAEDMEKPVGLGEWIRANIIMLIPVVNVIMSFVWAFGSRTARSKANFFKAHLIFMAIKTAALIVLIVGYGMLLLSVAGSYY